MSGCFGSSAVDRWMEGNLDRYLDSQEDYGYRTLTFKLWKGKKLIQTWSEEVSNEDGCSHLMRKELVRMHTKRVTAWLAGIKEDNILVSYSRKWGYTVCDQETFDNYHLYSDSSTQKAIVEKWSMMPKASHISHSTGFNIYRMGKYSITCFDPLKDD